MRAARVIAAMLRITWEADRRLTIGTAASELLFGVSMLGVALSLKIVVDAALQRDPVQGLLGAAVAVVSLAGGVGLLPIGGNWSLALQEKTAALIDERLMTLMAAVPNLELQDRPDYQSKLQLLLDQRFEMQVALHAVMGNATMGALLIAVAVVLGMQHPLLALMPLIAIPTMWLGLVSERFFRRAQEATAEDFRLGQTLFTLAADVGAGKELRVFGLGDEVMRRQARAQITVMHALGRAGWIGTGLRALAWALFAAVYATAVFVVINRATSGQATAGDVILTIAVAAPVGFVATMGAEFMSHLVRALTTGERYQWLSDLASEASRPPSDPAQIPTSLREGIRFDHVSFRYPGSDETVLDDITLELPAGSVVALVGENGAGKTTLVKLVSRLYDPSEGQVTVDGTDLSRFPTADWRQRISAGFQDFVEFEVLARETVGLGDVERIGDGRAVGTGIERAGASDVLESLPEGLETQLGKEWDGAQLSTGQWQKFALARAFMRDRPLLLILDEPTAALDAAAEHALFERFARAARERRETHESITVLVSHRFSTVRMADLIIVLDGGRVVESGSHSELVRAGGLYADLYEIQARAYR